MNLGKNKTKTHKYKGLKNVFKYKLYLGAVLLVCLLITNFILNFNFPSKKMIFQNFLISKKLHCMKHRMLVALKTRNNINLLSIHKLSNCQIFSLQLFESILWN